MILPIRNEAAFIERSLGSVLAQDWPAKQMEVLVADGMSDDDTRAIVRRVADAHPAHRVRIIDNPGRIVPTGFNRALAAARGDVIVRVDGHCEIDSTYVRRCVEVLDETGASNVGGLQNAVGSGLVPTAIALATSSPFGVGGARFHYATRAQWVDTVYLGAWPRSIFNEVGGFDEELVRNQDDELNFRIRQSGGRIWLDPSIRSVYFGRASFKKLWRQYYQYGLYKVRVIQKRGGVASWRHLVPATFVVGLIALGALSLLTGDARWALAIAGPYAAVNLLASLWTARKAWTTLPLLPLVFFILHASYGAGFLWGLWKWKGRWTDSAAAPVTPTATPTP